MVMIECQTKSADNYYKRYLKYKIIIIPLKALGINQGSQDKFGRNQNCREKENTLS